DYADYADDSNSYGHDEEPPIAPSRNRDMTRTNPECSGQLAAHLPAGATAEVPSSSTATASVCGAHPILGAVAGVVRVVHVVNVVRNGCHARRPGAMVLRTRLSGRGPGPCRRSHVKAACPPVVAAR